MISEGFFSNPETSYKEAFQSYGDIQHQHNELLKINNTYDDISGQVQVHNNLVSELNNNPKEYQDFSGNWLAYRDKKSHVKEAVKEDIHTMILQQNNAYIIGMITITTVLITTYLVTKK